VIVLDHHKSAKQDLETLMFDPPGNLKITFDMNKSGAMLSWDFFGPMWGKDKPLRTPRLISYVQDRDLWRWELTCSEEVNTAIYCRQYDFDEWDRLALSLETDEGFEAIVGQGRAMLAYRDAHLARICKDPGFTRLEGHLVPCVNSGVWQSEIGNILAKNHPFAVIWFMSKAGSTFHKRRRFESSLLTTTNGERREA
jgi:hypothetical protein